ncbi:hypothetical protein [Nostoc sp. FACHB-280]|nr:hypothetical protein [Nostoc sp. FACHB-280]
MTASPLWFEHHDFILLLEILTSSFCFFVSYQRKLNGDRKS